MPLGLEILAESSADILLIERAALGTVDDFASNKFARVQHSYLRLQIAAKLKPSLLRQRAQMLYF
jgi:hypothetical protein